MSDQEHFFSLIQDLVMCHSPSGVEAEIDTYLLTYLHRLGIQHTQDPAGNIIALIKGHGEVSERLAITAHKDEIGSLVKSINHQGHLSVRKLGGSFPWVYGEGVVDILADGGTFSGILSFGSRHISHESPQKVFQEKESLHWEDAWIETGLSPEALLQAGVHPGTRVVVGKQRKHPILLGSKIGSYTLDNKASVAILLKLLQRLQQEPPRDGLEVNLVFSSREEVGALGALYFTQHQTLDTLIALEVAPVAPEYPILFNENPVLLAQDGYGVYDDTLNHRLARLAQAHNLPLQWAVISGFGSDGSLAMKAGHVPQAACLGFPTQNTHGYEITFLPALRSCLDLLALYCQPEHV
jgi:putative aminopeptidase FrvX